MRVFALAFALLGLTGWARAAAVDWSAGDTFTSQSTTFSVAITFQGSAIEGMSGDGLYIGHNAGTNEGKKQAGPWAAVGTGGRVWKKGSNPYTDNGHTDTWGQSGEDNSTSGRYALAGGQAVNILSDRVDGLNVLGIVVEVVDSSVIYHYWLNGVEVGTFSHNNIGQNVRTWDNLSTAIEGELWWMEGEATAAQFAQLPEPTALALLALGVAGLALRRRA